MQKSNELIHLLKSTSCDYGACRRIIKELGGCTKAIEGRFGGKTTPLQEVIDFGHYDFALELISQQWIDLNALPNTDEPLIWQLQYLDAETDEDAWYESEGKLRIIRALIKAGANPNPCCGGEELLPYIRYKIGENEMSEIESVHLWQMEHIIEAHTHGNIKHLFEKLEACELETVLLSEWGFRLFDDNLCDCDHAVLVFKDGEKMTLSSYMVDDDEWNFYSVRVSDETQYGIKYRSVKPNDGNIKYFTFFSEGDTLSSHWLDFYIDDALLRIHAQDPNIAVGIVCKGYEGNETRKRINLFKN